MKKEDLLLSLFLGGLIGFFIGFAFSPNMIISNKSELKPYKIIITEKDTTYYYNE